MIRIERNYLSINMFIGIDFFNSRQFYF